MIGTIDMKIKYKWSKW